MYYLVISNAAEQKLQIFNQFVTASELCFAVCSTRSVRKCVTYVHHYKLINIYQSVSEEFFSTGFCYFRLLKGPQQG